MVNGGDATRTRVRDIMSTTLFSCPSQASLEDALHEMRERQVRRLPIVDDHGEVVGIVVRSELLRASIEGCKDEADAASGPDDRTG